MKMIGGLCVMLFIASATALVFDNELSNRPIASDNVIFQIGMGASNQIDSVVVHFGGTVHIGTWYGDYTYARANSTAVSVECEAGDTIYKRWADTSPSAEEVDYIVKTGPKPSYARPIYGDDTNQRFACRVPGDNRASESDYGQMIHGAEGMFRTGSLYNGPSCLPEDRRADVYVKTGLPATNVQVLSATVSVTYPHPSGTPTCVASGVADGIYYKRVDPTSTVTLYSAINSRGNYKSHHENDVVVWTALTIGFHLILGLLSVTKLCLFVLCANPRCVSKDPTSVATKA